MPMVDCQGVAVALLGLAEDMPEAGKEGRLFFATDEVALYIDDGEEWINIVG